MCTIYTILYMCDGPGESRVVYFSRFLSDSFSIITAPGNGFYHLKKKKTLYRIM